MFRREWEAGANKSSGLSGGMDLCMTDLSSSSMIQPYPTGGHSAVALWSHLRATSERASHFLWFTSAEPSNKSPPLT